MRRVKRILAIMLALVLCMNQVPAVSRAEGASSGSSKTTKFELTVSSTDSKGNVGKVVGTAYSDYSATLTIDRANVNSGNITFALLMQDVGSLNVSGTRTYTRTMTLGAGNDHSLGTIANLFGDLDGTKITAVNGNLNVVYSVSKTDEDGYEYEATPDTYAHAHDVWHSIVNSANLEAATAEDSDSYILIANGSSLSVGSSVLGFETAGDLTIDNLDKLSDLNAQIRAAIRLTTDNEDIGDQVKIVLKKGTKLKVGQSYAALLHDLTIRISGTGIDAEPLENSLVSLRDIDLSNGGSIEDLVAGLFGILSDAIHMVAGKDMTVEFDLAHEWGEPEWSWEDDYSAAMAAFACTLDGCSETVTANAAVESSVTPADEYKDGQIVYTATVELDGKTYTDTKMVVLPKEDFKFRIRVSSVNNAGTTGSVTGTVYEDYLAVLKIDEGVNVNSGNVTIDVFMQNVASLGVDTLRHYGRTIQLSSSGTEHSLRTVANLFAPLDGTTVIGISGTNEVPYTVRISESGYEITAIPSSTEKAAAVWHGIVNAEHIETGTSQDEDSYIILANGASLQVGSKILKFEKAEGDLKIDNLSDFTALEAAIREAVRLTDAEEAAQEIVITLPAGTELALGSSFAKLSECAKITVSSKALGETELASLEAYLTELQGGYGSMEDAVIGAYNFLQQAVDMLAKETVYVEFEFGHEWGEPEWTWAEDLSSAEAVFTCANGGETLTADATVTIETVDADCEEAGAVVYTATVELDGVTYTDTQKEEMSATGHDWDCTDIIWEWADGFTSANAVFTCKNNAEHTLSVDADITAEAVEPTETEDGVITYTATVTGPDGESYTDVRTETVNKEDFKFKVKISSVDGETTGAVTGTVYADYSAVLKIDQATVNTSNVTLDVYMQHVASLGVDALRHYSRSLQLSETGRSVSLDYVKNMVSGADGTTAIVRNDGNTVVYTVRSSEDGYTYTALPNTYAQASAVWHSIVNEEHIGTGSGEEDSFIVVGKGASIQTGGVLLKADDEFRIDNLNEIGALEETIRAAVSLTEGEDAEDDILIRLPEGMKIALGSSYAELAECTLIRINGDTLDGEALAALLKDLRDADLSDVQTALVKVMGFVKSVIDQAAGQTLEVTFEFGHDWGEPTYEWSEDLSEVTATRTCANDPDHVETETVKTTSEVTTPATCLEAGETTYTAVFENEAFETQTKTAEGPEATGHDWGEPTYEWSEDLSEVTATRTCANDPEHVETETVKTTSEVTKEATCEEQGETTYTAEFENEAFETQTKTEEIEATGHDWEFAGFTWSEDHKTATAEYICANDETHTESVDAEVTEEVTKEATDYIDGEKTYTAEVSEENSLDGEAHTETYTEAIPASDAYKFRVKVSSEDNGEEGSVTGTVYADYVGILALRGDAVNTSNVTVDVYMQNVASLGVTSLRHYGRTIAFPGTEKTVPMSTVENLLKVLDGITVIGINGENRVTYVVTGEEDGRAYKATPDSYENASAVWHSIVNEENIGTKIQEAEDSCILVKKGSSVQAGGKILQFEGEDDLKIDDLSNFSGVEEAIRGALELAEAEESTEGIVIRLAAGTELALGTSVAELKQCVTITITGDGIDTAALETALETARDTELTNAESTMKGVLGIMSEVLGQMSGHTTEVEFEFGHEAGEEVIENEVEATCEEDGSYDVVTYCEICGEELSRETVAVEATGHDWSEVTYEWSEDLSEVTATRTCANDPEHVETETVKTTSEVTTPATCLEAGETTYTAAFENEAFETQTKTAEGPEATGHDWDVENAVWNWSEDKSMAVVTVTCKNDETHVETVVAEVELTEEQDPTCEEAGVKVYTATAVLSDETEVTDTQEEALEATGHTWEFAGFTWSEDHKTATAEYICANDETHTESVDAEVTESRKLVTENGITSVFIEYTASVDEESSLDGTAHEETQRENDNAYIVSNTGDFSENLKLNYYIYLPEEIREGAYVVISFNGSKGVTETTQYASEAETSTKNNILRYRFFQDVLAKEMRDEATLRIYDGNGNLVSFYTGRDGIDRTESGYVFSLMDYLELAIEKGTAEMSALALATKNYGTAAQLQFNYKTDGLEIAEEVTAVTADDLAPYEQTVTGTLPDGVTKNTSTVMFESDNSLRQHFILKSASVYENLTFYIGSTKTEPEKYSDTRYILQSAGYPPKFLDQTVSYTVTDGTNTYRVSSSPLGYAYKVLAAGTASETMENLAKAFYLYFQAAKTYFVED